MESLLRKSLNKREKRFEISQCPSWLLTILPTRIKTVESIIDNDNEQQIKEETIDLKPYKLISSIPILNKDNEINFNQTSEYPNNLSFEYEQLNNYFQLIHSLSNQQFIYLLNKLKEFEIIKNKNSFTNKSQNKCKQIDCLNKPIPLNLFCKNHLLENNFKQILFVPCTDCEQISIKHDQKNLLHICSHFNSNI
ncbi:unnamed protein product [Adineta steineri]|uniref:Uncharacterized protein n=1 Tax=Adineta steineri TaxID=433720 RepID=A0A814XKC8_9BILA|nr:unnamed protein product [Adineta steineri]CAF3521477.1 unnamed protein product [Adineta steineri]